MNEHTRTTGFSVPTAILALLLGGCGSSSPSAGDPPGDGDVDSSAVTVRPTENTAAGGEASASGGPDEPSGLPSAGALSDTMDCAGAIASAASPGRDVETASPFVIGEFVSSSVRVGDVDYWRVTVEPGQRYRVVLDTTRAGGDATRTGLIYRSSIDNGTTWTRNIASDEADDRLRETRLLSVFGTVASAELLLTIESQFGPESYHLAVLERDASVPAPYAVDCPSVAPLTVGTSEAFELGDAGSDTEDRWFTFAIPADGAFALSLSASSNDPQLSAPIDYGFRLFGEFGQRLSSASNDIERLDTDSAVSHTTAIPLRRVGSTSGESNVSFLRFRNYGPPLLVEASLVATP